jgi:hypothetical protein
MTFIKLVIFAALTVVVISSPISDGSGASTEDSIKNDDDSAERDMTIGEIYESYEESLNLPHDHVEEPDRGVDGECLKSVLGVPENNHKIMPANETGVFSGLLQVACDDGVVNELVDTVYSDNNETIEFVDREIMIQCMTKQIVKLESHDNLQDDDDQKMTYGDLIFEFVMSGNQQMFKEMNEMVGNVEEFTCGAVNERVVKRMMATLLLANLLRHKSEEQADKMKNKVVDEIKEKSAKTVKCVIGKW